MNKLNRYCFINHDTRILLYNTREYTNIPSCCRKLVFDSSCLQEEIFVYTFVKLYNKANLKARIKMEIKYAYTELPIACIQKVRKKTKIRNRYNQVPHLTQDTVRESDKNTRKHHIQESQEVSPFPAGDHKAA